MKLVNRTPPVWVRYQNGMRWTMDKFAESLKIKDELVIPERIESVLLMCSYEFLVLYKHET